MNPSEATSLVIGCCEPSAKLCMPVLDGSLPIAGCSTRFVKLGAGEMLLRAFADPELNVAELSLSNYVSRVAAGDCPYVMLPVYTARAFPQPSFFARSDRGIETLADLRGKRIGSSAWPRTLNVWLRGFLADECGILPSDVQWAIRDTPDVIAAFEPKGVSIGILDHGKTLSEHLASGAVDALMSLHPPECFTRGHPMVKRIPADPDTAAADYFERANVYPILHVMGIRRTLLAQQPALADKLYRVFDEALGRSLNKSAAIKDQAFNYGLGAAELKSLERFVDYHHTQGLSQRRLEVAELFAPVAMTDYSG